MAFAEYMEMRGYKDSYRTDTYYFKFSVWLYRKFGYFNNYLRLAQDDFIRENLDKMLGNYIKNRKEIGEEYDMSFSGFYSCETGCWQAHHNICRRMSFSSSRLMLRFRIKWFLRKHRIM